MLSNQLMELTATDIGSLAIAEDTQAQILNVRGTGFWSPQMVCDHFAKLNSVLKVRRGSGIRARVMVDLREAGVQSQETIDQLSRCALAYYTPGDRIAIIVGSSLAKMQMRRVIRCADHEFFLSPNAAATWLEAV